MSNWLDLQGSKKQLLDFKKVCIFKIEMINHSHFNSKHLLSMIINTGEYQKMAKKLIQIQFEFF